MADQHEHAGDEPQDGQPVQASPSPPPTAFPPASPPPSWSASSGYGTTGYGMSSPSGTSPAPGYSAPGYGTTATWPPQSTQPLSDPGTPGQFPPSGNEPPGPDRPRRRSGGPGWGGVVGVAAGAAVLSSLLTAGIVRSTDDTTSASSSQPAASSSSAQSAAPLVTSTTNLPDWVAVAGAVEPSVVAVQVQAGQSGGEGSGVLLDSTGRILTNNHVVSEGSGTPTIRVVLSDGRGYPASIVGTDPSTDLAVIKINSSVSGLKAATIGDSSAVKIGDPVMAVGNPLGLSDTVTTGIVSAVNRPVSTESSDSQNPFSQAASEPVVTNAIQTDAAINPGNSGGALVDAGGRVIGITSSIASLSSGSGQSGSIGLGFAIPINEAKQVADELIAGGPVQHAYLGVGLQDDAVTLDGAEREAAIVRTVSSGTPAAKAGLKAGDAIIAVNGQRIDGRNSLIGTIRATKPGTEVTLTLVRDGSSQDVKVTLATRPGNS